MSAHTSARMPGDPSETVACIGICRAVLGGLAQAVFRGGARHNRGAYGVKNFALGPANVTALRGVSSAYKAVQKTFTGLGHHVSTREAREEQLWGVPPGTRGGPGTSLKPWSPVSHLPSLNFSPQRTLKRSPDSSSEQKKL